MNARLARTAMAGAVLIGIGGFLAAPAFAEPQYVCVLTSSDRRGICLETDRIPPPSFPTSPR